jgi:hypothetical protein
MGSKNTLKSILTLRGPDAASAVTSILEKKKTENFKLEKKLKKTLNLDSESVTRHDEMTSVNSKEEINHSNHCVNG